MEVTTLQEIADHCPARGDEFPFRLGRQTGTSPFGIGIGFEITDMADRLMLVERARAGERRDVPIAWRALPIERRFPVSLINLGPGLGQPEFRPAVAAVGNEGGKFACSHRARSEAERRDIDLVPRPFV